ncbi:MAG: glycosyltransferase family 1 protein [Hydrogenophaga sp.]|jgi:glycosyltransferase involved in cell wall biosynthesis|uniref:glycosyltransferase family 4 protein n=1 Tax=Hydrogenophaga sp. TaxID=1904254 RepID=UPI002604F9D6|nr:glycosyltransferase family 1 protein [Hydrogenophaga sp.]MCV0437902.1 glycosyltransferase family 1 protein [Hydrogenophaga sp.]
MTTVHSDQIVVEEYPATRPSLRLSVVTETWPPEINGVSLTLSHLVRGLCARNHQVQLVRPRQTRVDQALSHSGYEEVLMRGMPIPRYPELKLGLPGKRALIQAWTLRRPDLVHIATEGPLGWSALQAARRLRLPVTSDFRTNFHAYSEHYGVGWLRKPIVAYLRKFHNLTRLTMVPTQALRADLMAIGFENVQVVARGVDTQQFNPDHRSEALRASWGTTPRSIVLLAVGRLAAEKNLDLVVRAFDAMRAAHDDVKLVFVGDGPMRESLQQRCPQAVFAGMRQHGELAAWYASADLFLFPSVTETFGNVTVEALASGLPVLAFDTAAAADWVRHDGNGWLVPVNDEAGYLRMVVELATQSERIALARAQARAQVAQLDWQQIARQVEGLFLHATSDVTP